jgi:serpin B
MKKAPLLITFLLINVSSPTFSQSGRDSIADSFNRMTFQIFGNQSSAGSNFLISPLSFGLSLTAVYSASRVGTEAGIAAFMKSRNREQFNRQLKTFLGRLLDNNKRVQISQSCMFFVPARSSFLTDYGEELKERINCGTQVMDVKRFESQLNSWFARTTMNKSPEMTGLTNPATSVAVFGNTFYFYGTWETQFDVELNKTLPFYTDERSFVHVDFMNQSGNFGYMENEQIKAIEIPFNEKDASFILIIPKRETNAKVSYDQFRGWLGKIKWQKMDISIPKFRIYSKAALDGSLKELGLRDLYDRPDLSFMTNSPDARVEQFVQTSFIELHEKGAEAATGTSLSIGTRKNTALNEKTFAADRPFLFFIRDNVTGLILLLGKVSNPIN